MSNPNTPHCRLPFLLILLASVLTPLLIAMGLHGGTKGTAAFQVSNLWVQVSQVGTPTEIAWIWPKVLVILFTGVLGLVFWRELGFRFQHAFPLLLLSYSALVWASAFLAWEEDWSYRVLGGFGRLDGPLYQSGLVLFGVLAYLVFRKCKRTQGIFLATLAGVSGIEALVLLIQRAGHDFVGGYLIGGSYPAPVGTIGHPGMAAGLLLAGFFAAGWSLLAAQRRENRWAVGFWLALAILIAAGIGASTNKASTYAILLSLVGLIALFRHRTPLTMLVAFLVGAFLVTPLVPNRIGFQRSLGDTHTGQTRFVIWKLAWESIGRTPGQPLIGAGPDGFLLTLARKIPISELLQEYRIEYGWPPGTRVKAIRPLFRKSDPVRSRAFLVTLTDYPQKGKEKKIIYRYYLDKAHDLFLDRAVSYGILAALVWVWLYLWPLARYLRTRPLDVGRGILAAGLVALFLYYLAWFPVPAVEPLHLAFLALAWAEVSERR